MRIFRIGLVLLLSACHSADPSVYDQPLPSQRDPQALSRIGGQLKPEDKEAWASIKMRIINPVQGAVKSKTVGEAINRWKAQRACLQLHAKGQLSAGTDVKARDREIDAYNDCLEMEI